MTRVAEKLEPSSSEPQDRQPNPGPRIEQLADRIRDDARGQAEPYLRETVVPEGGE
ncbi:MAG: hypothetical protein AAGF11_00610 [Myxococcota bacterium]